MATIDPQIAADAYATIQQVAPGLTPTQYMLLLGHAWFESRWGRGDWMVGSNNWGSYQVTPGWAKKHANDPGYGALPYTDSLNTGTSYGAALRVYPDQLSGCSDWYSTVIHGYFGGNVPSDAETYAAELHPHNVANAQGVFVGNYYGGSGTDAQAIINTYASWVSSGAAAVSAALAVAAQKGLVGNPNVTGNAGIATTGKHAVKWFVAPASSGGGDGLVACLVLFLVGVAWKRWL